jgi:uncharacterized protein
MTIPRLYILPGWQNSGPDHWQSLWVERLGAVRVEQSDWDRPLRGDWMARLDEVITDDALLDQSPAVLVAHSLGCHLVAAWAAHSRLVSRVQAALLVAPPDVERVDMPPHLHGWRPAIRQRLPFRSVAVISADDPYGSFDSSSALAREWGAEIVPIGARGHINGASGLGDWPDGQALLKRLCSQA